MARAAARETAFTATPQLDVPIQPIELHMAKLSLIVPLLMTIGGGVLYHLAAKSVPRNLDPAFALIWVYSTALCASVVTCVFLPNTSTALSSSRSWHPAVIAVGLGAVLIELGYLLIYRAASPVSVTSVMTNGIVAVLLVPIGIAIFGEQLTVARGLGIVLCLIGVLLRR
jgi:drug/metabolite transporter (DMT)-like permease